VRTDVDSLPERKRCDVERSARILFDQVSDVVALATADRKRCNLA